jgi:hypothetical protein
LQWWSSLGPLARPLAIALVAPLALLNAWALATIFGYFQSLLAILTVAALLSFVLSYPVGWLSQRGVRRGPASIFVFLVALSLVIGVGVTLVPLAVSQAQQLVARLPEWIDSGQQQLMMLNERAEIFGLPISLDGAITQFNDRLKDELQRLAGRTLNLALNVTVLTVVRLLDVLLTVVLTFYLVQHSDEIWESLINWLPDRARDRVSRTLRSSFQNYFIGQILNATSLGGGDGDVCAAENSLWSAVWPNDWAGGPGALWRLRGHCGGDCAGGPAKHYPGVAGAGGGAAGAAGDRKFGGPSGAGERDGPESLLGVRGDFDRGAGGGPAGGDCGGADGGGD